MDSYLFLAASLLALAAGPLAAKFAGRSVAATSALDSFVAVTVAGISLLHVLPHAFIEVGWPSLLALAAGFALPLGLGHRHGHGRGDGEAKGEAKQAARSTLILVAFLGLGVHAVLDGFALFAPRPDLLEAAGHGEVDHHGTALVLALAVVLHRFPMALAIWLIARPSLGRPIATGLLALIGAGTVGGFAAAAGLWRGFAGESFPPGFSILQAAIAGMLLHMVLGHHEHDRAEAPPRASAAGALAGIVAVAALTRIHLPEQRLAEALPMDTAFSTLALTAAPALLLAYLGIAWIHALASPDLRILMLGRETLPARRLSSLATVFVLVSRPEIQLSVLALSLSLLGPAAAAWRLLSVGLVVGLTVLSMKALLATDKSTDKGPADDSAPDPGAAPAKRLPDRLLDGLRFGLGTAVDRSMPWILVGLGIAAFLESMIDFSAVQALRMPAQLTVLALLGVPLYLLGLGVTPVALVLVSKGFGLGPVLAFLLAGVAVSGSRRLARELGARAGWSFAVRMLLLAMIWSYAVDRTGGVPGLHELAADAPGPLAAGSALVLTALTAASLFRQGFRGFLQTSTAMTRWHEAGL